MMTSTAMTVAAEMMTWLDANALVGREYSDAYLSTEVDAQSAEVASLSDAEHTEAFEAAANYLCELGAIFPTVIQMEGFTLLGFRALIGG